MRRRVRRSRRAAKPSSANGGSSPAPSPTAWRKPATGSSPSPVYRRASGVAPAPRMQSNDCTRSSSEGSRRRPCCRPRTPLPCCSGHCSPLARSTCARSMAGRRSPQSSSISQLTSQPETISSCYRRSRHTEFQPHSGRHQAAPLPRQSRAKWRLLVLDAVLTRSSHFNWTAPYRRRRLSSLGLCSLREAPMERFVHNEYLIHLRKQVAGTTDEVKRRQTSTLLPEEEVKDHLPSVVVQFEICLLY